MRQFDVFANPDRLQSATYPYLLILQSDFVDHTSLVVAAPFTDHVTAIPPIYPAFTIGGRRLMLLIPDLASLPRTLLLLQPVTNLAPMRDRIIRALDILFIGF